MPHTGSAHSTFNLPGMIAFEAGLLVVGALLIMGKRLGGPEEHHGVMLGAAAGILFGVSDVAIKAMTGLVGSEGVLPAFLSPWIAVTVLASVAAFYASAKRPAGRRRRPGHRRHRHRGQHLRASPAASSSSAIRIPATRSGSSSRPSPSSWSSSPRR